MTREQAKNILGENATEEQISNLLNQVHNMNKDIVEKLNNANAKLNSYSDYDTIKKQLDDINKANMTEQQKLDEQRKEIEKNLSESRIIVNTAKAKEILAGLVGDETIADLVSEDIDKTIASATRLANQINSLKEDVAKQTKEELLNLDLKPNMDNANNNDDAMTLDKFYGLSTEEQNKFVNEHPEEFERL